MNQKLKTICLILITIAVLIGVGFFWYQWQERQEEMEVCILNCDYKVTVVKVWEYRGTDRYFSTRDECVDWCMAGGDRQALHGLW